MLTLTGGVLVMLSSSLPVCIPSSPSGGFGVTADPKLEALYEQGQTYTQFRDTAKKRRVAWRENYTNARVPEALLARVAAVPGAWRLLVVAEDWCGDSANTIPYVAKLVDRASNLEMRIIRSKAGRKIMETHRTPDGRAATPTVLLLDAAFDEVGCWIERPFELQEWFLASRPTLEEDTLLEQKYAWYDEDQGQQTLEEIVRIIEAAAVGERVCGD